MGAAMQPSKPTAMANAEKTLTSCFMFCLGPDLAVITLLAKTPRPFIPRPARKSLQAEVG
jgi:hypothetical protein